MKVYAFIGILVLLYCMLALILLFVENAVIGSDVYAQVLPMFLLSVGFFAYSIGSIALFQRLWNKKRAALTGYYLADKVVRLLFCIAVLIVAGFLMSRDHLVVFAINLFAFYFVTALATTVYNIKVEKKYK